MNWFVALEGKVSQAVVGDLRDQFDYREGQRPPEPVLRLFSNRYGSDDYGAAPIGLKLGDFHWVANSKHVDGLHGLGITPEAAILDFDAKMKMPTP